MKSLYRRYRPMNLDEVVGQEQVTISLGNVLEQNKVGHAYLFIGPRGCGKTSVARIFAHAVNGFKYEIEDSYVDIIEIDGASNRGIDNIRDLREKAAIAPTQGKYKIYIIDEVHMLTKEAFNALLKTLEEPPAHVIFIMATTDAYKVPITITSRAQSYTFKLADHDKMLEFLKSVATKEKINITDDAMEIIVKKGGGSFRDSLSLLDQISTLSDKEITKDLVVSAMGLPNDEDIKLLLSQYTGGSISGVANGLKEILSSGIKPETLVEEMVAYILDNPKPELLSLLERLPSVAAPFAEAKLLVALRPAAKNKAAPIETVETKPISFDWDDYLMKIKDLSDVIFLQLQRCKYVLDNNHLEIYPKNKIVKNILESPNNKKILNNSIMGGIKITIHEPGESSKLESKDELIDKISDIMGGEVQKDGGKNPF